jgi:coenzyme PQQ synthesis protein D (PqqD)
MAPSRVYSKNPDYVQRDVAGECILVPIRRTLPDSNSIYVLNDTGAALWNRIDGKRSVQAITEDFMQEYDVAKDQLTGDLETLLTDLRSIHAIDEVSADDGPTG